MAIPVLLVIAAQPARANLDLTFSDRAAWESATSVKGVISFTGLGGAPGDPQFPDKGYPNGLTVDGVTFLGGGWGGGRYLYVRSGRPDFLYGPADGSIGCPAQIGDNPPCLAGAGITVTLPSDITSVGWDFGNFYLAGVTIHFLSGRTVTDTNFSGFVGFESTEAIVSLNVGSAGFPTISRFAYGSVSPIPEPSSILLLLTVIAAVLVPWNATHRRV